MTFVAGTLDSSSGGPDENDAKDGRLIATYDVTPPITHNPHGDHKSREGILVSGSIGASAGKQRGAGIAPETLVSAYGGNRQSGPLDVATACNAKGGTGRSDFENETFVVQQSTAFNWQAGGKTGVALDANEEHTGALQTNQVPAVAFAIRGREGGSSAEVAEDGISNALRTPGGGFSHQMVAVGLDSQLNPAEDLSGPLNITSASGGGHPAMVATVAQVRRLTPTECERLQSLSWRDPETGEWLDGWTCLCGKNRGRSAAPLGEEPCSCADGNRYRALGNGLVVNCAEWVLRHIIPAASDRV